MGGPDRWVQYHMFVRNFLSEASRGVAFKSTRALPSSQPVIPLNLIVTWSRGAHNY